MTFDNEAANLPETANPQDGEAAAKVNREWDHIGAIIVDATLQRRQNYNTTVHPRVTALVAAWPDAATTSEFRQRLDTGMLSEVISWPSPGRLAQVEDITCVFESQGIETVVELRERLSDPATRAILREALAAVRHVSAKTLDYFDTLSGVSTDIR